MLLIAVLAIWTFSQEPRITLTSQAESIQKAVQQIGPLVHMNLKTSLPTANDIVCFRLVDVPASEVTKRIAEIDDATWKQEADGLRLVRTSKQLRSEEDVDAARSIASIDPTLKKLADGLGKRPPWTAEQADKLAEQLQGVLKDAKDDSRTLGWFRRNQALMDQAPLSAALHRMIVTLGAKGLMSLSQSITTVWSTRPTPSQKPFPSDLADIVGNLQRDQAILAKSMEDRRITAPDSLPNWGLVLGTTQSLQPQAWGTVLFRVTPTHGGGNFDFLLTAFDDQGKQVAQAGYQLFGDAPPVSGLTDMLPKPDEKQLDFDAWKKVPLTAYEPNPRIAKSIRPEPDILAKITNPESVDPLSLSGSPLLLQLAELRNVNMLVRLPDDAFDIYLLYRGAKFPKPSKYFESRHTDCSFEFKDGWLTGKPLWPASSRTNECERHALGNFMRRLDSDIGLSVDEQAVLMAPLPERDDSGLPWYDSDLLNRPNTRLFDSLPLRFYSRISSEQKRAMETDGVRISNLDSVERDYLERMVFGPGGLLQYSGTDPVGLELHANGLLSEATEALPNGLPANGIATLKVEEATALFLPSGDSNSHGSELEPHHFALLRFMQDHRNSLSGNSSAVNSDLSNLVCGRRQRVTITFQFTPNLSYAATLNGGDIADLHPITFDQIPADYKSEFDRYYSAYEKQSPGAARKGGGTIPPVL